MTYLKKKTQQIGIDLDRKLYSYIIPEMSVIDTSKTLLILFSTEEDQSKKGRCELKKTVLTPTRNNPS